MVNFKNLRSGTGFLAAVALLIIFTFSMTGCSDEGTGANPELSAAPKLPDAEQLQFDFSFFNEGSELNKSGEYENFVNAYLRTVVLDAMAHLVLVAPVTAFSAAVHTVPVAQEDGSWVWTYHWNHRHENFRIILRGMPSGDVVAWELSLAPVNYDVSVLWFSGTTSGSGNEGHWEFRDLDTEGHPVSGAISWGANYLEFTSGEDESLRFENNAPDYAITFSDVEGASHIRWNESGEGSLQVPDYNDGLEACWDIYQRNADCQ